MKQLIVIFCSLFTSASFAASVSAMAKKGQQTLTSWFFATMVLSVIGVAWKLRKGKPEARENLEMIFESAFLVAAAGAIALIFK